MPAARELGVFDFDRCFKELTGHVPLRWQRRLFEQHLLTGRPPSALDLPTGLGKTSVMAIWYLARDAGASLPRRLVYVVDRRAVVDQATDEAEKIKEKIKKCSGDPDLRISTLRGKHADNRKWLEDPALPAIVVGTVDMIGSRLLFEGYGVGRRMRSYHAGLLGADALVVLDESHLVPPFERLLEQIARGVDLGPKEKTDRDLIPRFHLLLLSATGRDRNGDVFRLTKEDHEDPVVKARLGAKKRLTLAPVGDNKKLEERLAEEAWALSGEGKAPVRILTYCNNRNEAEKTRAAIEKLAKPAKIPPENFQLFVGARRVKEREDAKKELADLGFFSGNKPPEKPAFVFATSAGEVGVDLNADHMVMDVVPFERMVQRLGRVNRLGGKDARVVALYEDERKLKKARACSKDHHAIIAWRALKCLKKLPRHEDDSHDASPGALGDLKGQLPENEIVDASTPNPIYPALTRPLVDAWSMTSLKEHAGRPEVHPWLRGWTEDPPQTTLIWRKFLPVRVQGGATSEREVADFFEAAPPHLTEKLEVDTDHVCKWLLDRAKKKLAEVIEKADTGNVWDADSGGPPPIAEQRVVAVVLDHSGAAGRCLTFDHLVEVAKDKKELKHPITNRTLVLDARMGGLSKDGLFDAKVKEPARTADADEDWETAIGFRLRSVAPGTESRGGDWHKPHFFDLSRNDEGLPLRQLRVEKHKDSAETEEERSLSPMRAQTLEEHEAWTVGKVECLVNALGIAGEVGDAIVLAARLHDEGKKAAIWQRAFSADTDGIYAKTKGPFLRNTLEGYRHEFGSLAHVERNNAFGALPDDLKDLALHLVAAHHGRARPVIETKGCEDGPPSLLEACADDIALRFARLQKRFGPWGLAWLEAILRAADQQASRDLDERRTHDG